MLENIFKELVAHYSKDDLLICTCWNEIEKSYSDKKRYYHTLQHLQKLAEQLEEYQTCVISWHTLLFSVFYHDIVYKVLRTDNEEKSATLAIERLQQIGFPEQQTVECGKQILATKQHLVSDNKDTNLFTDADLSVLGRTPEAYHVYTDQIRKEYAVYPDIIYKPGRRKVLEHFLKMDQIFKTREFFSKYEEQARQNLQAELRHLQ